MRPALARYFLGAVFFIASLGKIYRPVDFAASVSHYDLLPASLISPLAIILPWLEAIAGLFLILGFLSSSSALILGTLSAVFVLAVTTAMARGLSIECGCFVGNETISWLHPLANLVLLGLALYVLRRGPGLWALDNHAVFSTRSLAEPKFKRKRKRT